VAVRLGGVDLDGGPRLAGPDPDRPDRVLVGELVEHLADHPVDLGLLVAEVVEQAAERGVRDLELLWGQLKVVPERSSLHAAMLRQRGAHQPAAGAGFAPRSPSRASAASTSAAIARSIPLAISATSGIASKSASRPKLMLPS